MVWLDESGIDEFLQRDYARAPRGKQVISEVCGKKYGSISVIAAVDGELTVKRLHKTSTKTYLMPENKKFSPIEITEENDVTIWGVVTNVIHAV